MRYILVLVLSIGFSLALTGENITDPIVINLLPYNTQYTTVGYSNDYNLNPSDCTGHTTLGPDVVYMYTTPPDEPICVVLGVVIPVEAWDVALYVLTLDTLGNPVCEIGSDEMGIGGAEILEDVTLAPNKTYYFVIDGRNASDMGEYCFGISECEYTDISEAEFQKRLTLNVHPTVVSNGAAIEYSVPKGTYVAIQVYNSAGQIVNTLEAGMHQAGHYSVNWTGCDFTGKKLPGGVYFVKLRAGSLSKIAKVLLLN